MSSALNIPVTTETKTWKEYNRLQKEQRKQWKEERLIKKLKKEEKKQNEVENEMKKEENEKKVDKKNISTVSIAVPGSILDNAQSPELRTYLAGQIARAACIYKVDEIVVFDDKGEITENEKKKVKTDEVFGEARICCLQLAKILQYLECPQYLRRYFFPIQKSLQYAGVLNPLDAPHHLRLQDVSLYREGVVSNKPVKAGKGSQVNVGLHNEVRVNKVLMPGLRVTVKIPYDQEHQKKMKGVIVSPTEPRSEKGIYWGYSVRVAKNLSEVLNKCSYEDGYDLTIGTSDKGVSIDDVPSDSLVYQHALIVFGGLSGLEAALEVDSDLPDEDPSSVFHKYLNVCPQQGSRTIRTEEALLLSLAELRTKLSPKNPLLSNPQFDSFAKF